MKKPLKASGFFFFVELSSNFDGRFCFGLRLAPKVLYWACRRTRCGNPFLFAAMPCEKHETDFILEAFSIRDERVIPAGLACEWYIVLTMDETKSKHKEDQAPGTAPESNTPSQPKGVFVRIKAPFSAAFPVMIGYVSVSYTHLTLPTI